MPRVGESSAVILARKLGVKNKKLLAKKIHNMKLAWQYAPAEFYSEPNYNNSGMTPKQYYDTHAKLLKDWK